jgi:hypothetical protein
VLETGENVLEKSWLCTAKCSSVWVHRTVSGGAPDSVQCARTSLGEQSALGTRRRRTAKIHRTVRWCTGLSGEANSRLRQWLAAQSMRDAWASQRSEGGTGLSGVHRTVSGVPTAAKLQQSDAPKKGRRSRTGQILGLSGGTPDCPVRHPTEGKNCLSRMPPTTPSFFGAIKGTPRRMKESPKHTLSILNLPHFVSAHLIDFLSDLSSVLVVNLLRFIRAQVLVVCVCCFPPLL